MTKLFQRKYLLLLIAVHLFLFVLFFDLNIKSDGEFFYASIHSPIIDGDLDFSDDIRNVGWWTKAIEKGFDLTTPTGLVHNLHPIGSSLLNAPFFLTAHAVSILADYPTDGFSPIYTGAFNLGSVVYSFFGSVILLHILTKYLKFKMIDSFIGVLAMTLATPLLVYSFLVPSFSHAHSFFAVSLLMLIWLKYRNENNLRYWIFLGSTVGLIFMIRLVDFVFLVLPLIDLVLFQRQKIKFPKTPIHIGIYFCFILLAFSPMMYYWDILYGEFIPQPMPVEQHFAAKGNPHSFMNWTEPYVLEFLFSEFRGLFLWSPVFVLAIFGYYFLFKKHKQISIVAMLLTILVFYMHAAPVDWEAGGSFGQRRVADITPFLALGFVALLDRIGIISIKSKIIKSITITSLIFWNVIFVLIWKMERLILFRVNDLGNDEEHFVRWSFNFSEHVFPHVGNFPQYFQKQITQSHVIRGMQKIFDENGLEVHENVWFLILIIPSMILFVIVLYKNSKDKQVHDAI